MGSGGIMSWFRFETKAQRKKREKAYIKKMFPLGDDQKQWEIDMLSELFPNEKDLHAHHFQLLTLRELIIDASKKEDPEDDDYDEDNPIDLASEIQKWKKSAISRYISNDDLELIKKMGILEQSATSMENLPTAETIRIYTES